MAIEDGAVLGCLLGATVERQRDGGAQSVERKDIKSVLGLYERLRKARTSVNVKGAIDNRNFYHLPDGNDQQERDRVLENFDWVHGKGSWSWVDSVYQDDLLNFNAVENARTFFQD
jgi:salicylate hydroxylase